MDVEQTWSIIVERRRAVADLLDTLTEREWETPSLCAGWRIRDVAAHLAVIPNPPSIVGLLAGAVRARGSFDRLNRDIAVRHAARPPADIAQEVRRFAASRRMPVVTNHRNVLFDLLVHSQDIAVPLGRRLPMPVDAAAAGATRVWRMGWPFRARRRLRGLSLTATDTAWTVGAGPTVAGPIEALLLLLTGRTATALPRLTGPGTHRLAGVANIRGPADPSAEPPGRTPDPPP
jgi:uncharacterized protein (TIGR03083 family)